MRYLYIALTEIKSKLTYRFDLGVEFFSKLIELTMTLAVWNAVFSSGITIRDYDKKSMIAYLVISSVLSFLYTFEPCFRLGKLIHSGRLSVQLIRPINLWKSGLAEQTGRKAIYFIILFIPFVIFAKLHNYFVLSIILFIVNFVMFYSLMAFISTVAFWLENTWPLRPVFSAVYSLLGGILFPLDILPEPVYRILVYNPFALVGHVTAKTLTGSKENIALYILISVFYTLIFYFLYKIFFKAGLKKYEGVGL